MNFKVNKDGLKEAKWKDRKGKEYIITEPTALHLRDILRESKKGVEDPEIMMSVCVKVWTENMTPALVEKEILSRSLTELCEPVGILLELTGYGQEASIRKNSKRTSRS